MNRIRKPFSVPEATAMLSRTPPLLDVMLRDLPDVWLHSHEGGDTWSPYDILGHLIEGERTDWIPRARIILRHGDSVAFEPFDRFAQFRHSQGKTPSVLLEEFARLRQDNVRELQAMALDEAALDRPGRHPELGAVTLRQLLATWVAHDLDHVMQISRVLASQYADAVGPWRAYLRIISGRQG